MSKSTRSASYTFIKTSDHSYKFASKEKFHGPPYQLPTNKDVVERMLFEVQPFTTKTARIVAAELHTLWLECNVYTMSTNGITRKIDKLMSIFNRLKRQDVKRLDLASYKEQVKEFMDSTGKLFDIFCNDDNLRRNKELSHKLIMKEWDVQFYEDQKTDRKQWCTIQEEKRSQKSDERFRRDIEQAQKREIREINRKRNQDVADSTDIPEVNEEMNVDNQHKDPSWLAPKSTEKNLHKFPKLAMICQRYGISARAGAACGTATLEDMGLITEDKQDLVICRNKLRYEMKVGGKKIKKEEETLFSKVDGIYIDGKKDATLVMVKGQNGKYYSTVQIEEHYAVVGEPGGSYLAHVSPNGGTGEAVANAIVPEIEHTDLWDGLALVGSDSTGSMTGIHNGAIRVLEEILGRPLSRSICLLHLNELPLRHVFIAIDGPTTGPESWSGPIGSQLGGCVSDWEPVKFKRIPNAKFPVLPNDVIDDLSSDQYYAYRLCMCIMLGDVDDDLALMECGPLCHSRWLTLGCRLCRYYISLQKPTKELRIIVEFCILVYFPMWFQIKYHHRFTDGANNYHLMIKTVSQFPHKKYRDIALSNVLRNSYWAHHENILISMLADHDPTVRNRAVNRILIIRGDLADEEVTHEDFVGGDLSSEGESSDRESDDQNVDITNRKRHGSVRKYRQPKVNQNAKSYHELINVSMATTEPPITIPLTNEDLIKIRDVPLVMKHPYHNQCVERHIKVITDASMKVAGRDARDGLIRTVLKSRKIMKCYNVKKDYTLGH